MSEVVSKLVDADLEDRTSDELAASYRAICAAMLYRTALATCRPTPPRRQEIEQRAIARRWLAGGRGVISFPEACSAVDLDPEAALRRLNDCANPAHDSAISKGARKPRRHYVFGRKVKDGRADNFPGKSNPAAR